MKKARASSKRLHRSKGDLVIGEKRFAKVSAVEGITLTRGMKLRRAKFDRDGTPAKERRLAIIRNYSKG